MEKLDTGTGPDPYLQLYLDMLKDKFTKGSLADQDFKAERCLEWRRAMRAVSTLERVDSLDDSDCELDFEDGQVLLRKSASMSHETDFADRQIGNGQLDEKTMKRHLCTLMDTFENEKRKLDTKLQEEKMLLKKKMQHLYSKKIHMEREHYGRIITELIRLVDESKIEKENAVRAYRSEAASRKNDSRLATEETKIAEKQDSN